MTPLHHIPAVLVGLLLAGAGLRAAGPRTPEQLENAADEFAHGYDADWKKSLKTLAEDVGTVAACDEATTKALIEGAGPVAEKIGKHWRTVYRAYYLAHHELRFDDDFWDEYPEMLAGEICRKGITELNGMWDSLLHARLTPAQFQLWDEEMKLRHGRWGKVGDAWLKSKLAKLESAARKGFEARATRIVTTAEMPKERADRLNAAVAGAVEARMEVNRPYGQKVVREWGQDFIYYSSPTLKSLENGTYIGYRSAVAAATKAGNKVFDDAVNKLLLPEEQARMKAFHSKLQERIVTIAKDMSINMLQMTRSRLLPERQARLERLARSMGMDEKRRKEFEARLETAEKGIGEDWTRLFIASTTQQIKHLAERGDAEDNLKQMEQGRWLLSDEEADAKVALARGEAWKTAVRELVKPEELVRWEAAEKRASEQRARVFALVAVAELDRRLLLLPEQRAAIEKMAMSAAKPFGALPGDVSEHWQGDVSGSMMLVHSMGVKNVEAVLQESQKKGFRALAERCKSQWSRLKSQLVMKP